MISIQDRAEGVSTHRRLAYSVERGDSKNYGKTQFQFLYFVTDQFMDRQSHIIIQMLN